MTSGARKQSGEKKNGGNFFCIYDDPVMWKTKTVHVSFIKAYSRMLLKPKVRLQGKRWPIKKQKQSKGNYLKLFPILQTREPLEIKWVRFNILPEWVWRLIFCVEKLYFCKLCCAFLAVLKKFFYPFDFTHPASPNCYWPLRGCERVTNMFGGRYKEPPFLI